MSDKATEWIHRIKKGEEFRKTFSSYNNWKAYRNMYRNKWDENILPVNKIFSYGRMLIPRVYFNSPRITATASHPGLIAHARVVEAIDNMLIRETMIKQTLKKSCLDTFLCGIGPIKLGFDSEFGYMPEQSIDDDGATVTQHSRKDGRRIEYNETVKPGMPWALRVAPEDIIVPWGSEDFSYLPWIAHRIVRPLEDVKQDQKYKHTSELKGTLTAYNLKKSSDPYKPSIDKSDTAMYCELYEVRDYIEGRLYTICENTIILDEVDALQIEGLPYECITFNPDPEYIYGISDADILQAQQKELNTITTQAQAHRAIALLKFLYKLESIDETELQKFLSGNVGIGVGIKGDLPLSQVVMALQPHIPMELQPAAMACNAAMKESLGFSSNELGDYQTGSPRSATETMTVAQAFEQRIAERRDIVGDVLLKIIRKWNQYLFKFWNTERVIRVVGPDGIPGWVSYTGEQLKGEFFLSLDIDSGMPMNRAVKVQMANDLFMKFNGDMLVDQIGLRQILLDAYGSVDPRIPGLMQAPPGVDPKLLAASRQPMPLTGATNQGRGSAGGRAGSSPDKPEEFDSFKKRFEAKQ